MISDGESWSGEVEKSLQNALDAKVPVFVVGVGTLAGGRMPAWVPKTKDEEADPETPLFSRLDRAGLQKIAAVGGGQYFELDRDGDRHIANAIIDAAKRRAPVTGRHRAVRRSLLAVPGHRRRLHDRRTALSARTLRALDPADRRHPRAPRALHRDRVGCRRCHERSNATTALVRRSAFSVLRSSFDVRVRRSAFDVRRAASPEPPAPASRPAC